MLAEIMYLVALHCSYLMALESCMRWGRQMASDQCQVKGPFKVNGTGLLRCLRYEGDQESELVSNIPISEWDDFSGIGQLFRR